MSSKVIFFVNLIGIESVKEEFWMLGKMTESCLLLLGPRMSTVGGISQNQIG